MGACLCSAEMISSRYSSMALWTSCRIAQQQGKALIWHAAFVEALRQAQHRTYQRHSALYKVRCKALAPVRTRSSSLQTPGPLSARAGTRLCPTPAGA